MGKFTINDFSWYNEISGDCLTDMSYSVTLADGAPIDERLMSFSSRTLKIFPRALD